MIGRLAVADVREWDDVVVSGVDHAGLFHDGLHGTVGTRSYISACIKVWPGNPNAGDGSGKIWFDEDDITELIVFPECPERN